MKYLNLACKVLVIALVLTIATTQYQIALANSTYTLTGRVTNRSGVPLADTTVAMIDPNTGTTLVSTLTDPGGMYSLSVGEGTYNVRVTPPAVSGLGSAVALNKFIGIDTNLDFVLVPEGIAVFSGRLLDPQGEGIPGQAVILYPWGGGATTGTATDSMGNFSISVAPGDYNLEVSYIYPNDASNHTPSFYDIILSQSPISITQNTNLDLELPVKRVSVHVQDPAGNPVANARLDVDYLPSGELTLAGLPASGWNFGGGTSDASGNVTLWLFPTCSICSYKFTVHPPEDAPLAMFTIRDITLVSDKSLIIAFQFAHPSPMTTIDLLELPNAADEYPDPTTVSLTAVAAEGYTVDATYYRVDGGEQQTYTEPFVVTGGGSHVIEYWSVDNLGVFELPKTRTFNIITNRPPEITTLTAPIVPVQLGQTINATVGFNDPDVGDTHTLALSWGDGSTTTTSATVPSVTASHTYTSTGVYTVTATITDAAGEFDTETFQYIVIYDPNGGYVTGGGWINSPLGAYTPDPTLTGKATFGFVSKYQKGATVPTGNTEFQFHVANMNFKSTSYDWLVIAGSKAQYKGTGTINGTSNYGFMLTATDGSPDKFRIKIWDKVTGNIIYDNMLGVEETADPTTVIQGGSIVVHKAK